MNVSDIHVGYLMTFGLTRLLLLLALFCCSCGNTSHQEMTVGPGKSIKRTETTSSPAETLAVYPLEPRGIVEVEEAGQILAERLLPHFAENYALVDLNKLQEFIALDDLGKAGLMDIIQKGQQSRRFSQAVHLKAVRYLVVGTVTQNPDGSFHVIARIVEWQNGSIKNIAEMARPNWQNLKKNMRVLAARLQGTKMRTIGDIRGPEGTKLETNALFISKPTKGELLVDGRTITLRPEGIQVELTKGNHPFQLKLPGKHRIHGLFEVLSVDQETKGTVFGHDPRGILFPPEYIQAALEGRPVSYEYHTVSYTHLTLPTN